MSKLKKLIEYGQSYWLDNLTRGMIRNGELKERVEKQGLRGMTSNPSIFNKAISKSEDYDEQIEDLVKKGFSVPEIYEKLTVKDVRDACDLLRPVYDESDGEDGFVSLEVSPYLAHDTEGTMNEVRRLFKSVDRPNCFIKIPGTDAGVPAIEQMLYEGINVNITLLFSIQSYEAVAKAYVSALDRRLQEGKNIDKIASVASFFLSRIDVLTDQLLGHLIIPENVKSNGPRPEQLLGQTAVANAKMAYKSFKRIFSGSRWEKLANAGARVQRPLWASTSTKDPLYNDVRYVEPLIGPHTVNTMPEETISAFADHGNIVENSVENNFEEAEKILENLGKVGIDIDFVTRQLVNEGVQKFIDPYDQLMENLAQTREKILEDTGSKQTIESGKPGSKISAALDSLDEKQFARRLFAKDALLWKTDADQIQSIQNRLGWLNSIDQFLDKTDELTKFTENVKSDGIRHVVLLGMGGSSLCPQVAAATFGIKEGFPELHVLDITDPAAVKAVESEIDLEKSLFLVASKSGTTTETLSFYHYFYDRVKKTTNGDAGKQFVAITDPGTSLMKEASEKGFRKVFENPEDIGGRYSALSYFGLLPMALSGIDVRELLQRARQMKLSCDPFIRSERNPGVHLGAALGLLRKNGRDKVTFILSDGIKTYGYWAEQLIAESTGKEGVGLVPVEGESLGEPENYGNDRIFIYMYLEDEKDSAIATKLDQLKKAGHPAVEISLPDKLSLGGEFFRWELATAVAGAVIGVNPFDEPNVAESKKNTREILESWKKNNSFTDAVPQLKEDGLSLFFEEDAKWLFAGEKKTLDEFLSAFFAMAEEPDYLGLLAYFRQTEIRDQLFTDLRTRWRNKLKLATTQGYGPRYLHSTGQLHKGGPNTGFYIIFTADSPTDLNIPGEQFDFSILLRAQALGDFRSLNDKDRRVIRIDLGSDIENGLKKLLNKIG